MEQTPCRSKMERRTPTDRSENSSGASANCECTLADALSETISDLPEGVVHPSSRTSLRRRSSLLSASFAQSVLFECRLDPVQSPVDLCVCVSPSRQMHRRLRRETVQPADPGSVSFFPRSSLPEWWIRLRRICRIWEYQSHPVIRNLWIEIDQREENGEVPQLTRSPNLLLRIRPDARVDQICGWLERLYGRDLPPERGQTLQCIAQKLPDRGWISGIGAMLQREGQPIQVFVKGLTPFSIPSFLRNVGWKGAVGQIRRWKALLPEGIFRHTLALTVDETLQERFTIETRVDRQSLVRRRETWNRTLKALESRSFCPAGTAEGIHRWQGGKIVYMPHHWWQSTQIRSLSHLKSAVGSDGTIEIKAYLSAYLRYPT